MEIPRLPGDLLEAYRRLRDLTGMSSDAMDSLGIAGAVPASVLRPTDPRARVVAQAITVLNLARKDSAADAANRLSDIAAHNLVESGDILVVQGIDAQAWEVFLLLLGGGREKLARSLMAQCAMSTIRARSDMLSGCAR